LFRLKKVGLDLWKKEGEVNSLFTEENTERRGAGSCETSFMRRKKGRPVLRGEKKKRKRNLMPRGTFGGAESSIRHAGQNISRSAPSGRPNESINFKEDQGKRPSREPGRGKSGRKPEEGTASF